MKLRSIRGEKIISSSEPTLTEFPQKTESYSEEGKLPVDIYENDEEIMIITPIAGVSIDETEISISRDVLTIKGERKFDLSSLNFKSKKTFLKECFWGSFSRSIVLPTTVNLEKIEATEKNHVLYIRVPKKNTVQMRIVKIKSKE